MWNILNTFHGGSLFTSLPSFIPLSICRFGYLYTLQKYIRNALFSFCFLKIKIAHGKNNFHYNLKYAMKIECAVLYTEQTRAHVDTHTHSA